MLQYQVQKSKQLHAGLQLHGKWDCLASVKIIQQGLYVTKMLFIVNFQDLVL